ncbi:MAG TPA: hypothetical protein VID27_02615, partial [Blastocatellia bacterium]
MKAMRNKVTIIRPFIFVTFALLLSTSTIAQTPNKRELPAPTGKYAVGRISFHWVDQSRAEEITDDPNDWRELMVTVWYPAERATGEAAPYFANLERSGIDQLRATFIRSVRSHAIADAKISSAEQRYAVLVFSPGNEMNAVFYTAQIEDLASHGYIVIGMDHAYESLSVIYPDGRVARYTDLHPKPGEPNSPEQGVRLYRRRVDWRAADARFVLDQLEKLNAGNPASQFRGHLDLTRVGALGHSIGGVAAAQIC